MSEPREDLSDRGLTGWGLKRMESEEDLVERLIARPPIEEAEECLRQLEENLITVDVLRSAEQEDLEKELGLTALQCDAVLLDDTHWRAKYKLEHTGVPDASSETSKGERESGGSAMAETASGGQREREASAAAAAAIAGISQATVHPAMNAASGGGGSSSGVRDDDAGEQAADCKLARCFEMFGGLEGSAGRADSGARRYR